jgi:hypothetical protein
MLLSQTEKEWLLGNAKLSKGYERKVKSDIKKKIQNFQIFELPLLIEKGFISFDSPVTKNSNGVTKYGNVQNFSQKEKNNNFDNTLSNNIKIAEKYNQIYKNYMGRVGFEPTIPAMSRRYPNQARPPAPSQLSV